VDRAREVRRRKILKRTVEGEELKLARLGLIDQEEVEERAVGIRESREEAVVCEDNEERVFGERIASTEADGGIVLGRDVEVNSRRLGAVACAVPEAIAEGVLAGVVERGRKGEGAVGREHERAVKR